MADMRNVELDIAQAAFKCCFDPLKFRDFATAGVSGVEFFNALCYGSARYVYGLISLYLYLLIRFQWFKFVMCFRRYALSLVVL